MIKIYFGSSLDNLIWKIHSEYSDCQFVHLNEQTSYADIKERMLKNDLLQLNKKNIYLIEVSNWKLNSDFFKFANEVKIWKETLIMWCEGQLKKELLSWEIKGQKVYEPSKQEKTQMVREIAKQYHLQWDQKTMDCFIDHVSANFDGISNELKKLSFLSQPITISCLNEVLFFDFRQQNAFDIIECKLKKNYDQMIKIVKQFLLMTGEPVIGLIPILAHQLSNLKIYLHLKQRSCSDHDIFSFAKISYFVQKKYDNNFLHCQAYNEYNISDLMDNLYRLEMDIKLRKVVPYAGLVNWLLREK